jgi:hypothetical protein
MPIKKKTTAAKKPAAKKPAVLGPKAKLMKLLVGTFRNKAKKLGISDVSKRTKENLAQSIMLAEARKKRGTAMGKKATAKKKLVSTRGADRQTPGTPNNSIKADRRKQALAPGRALVANLEMFTTSAAAIAATSLGSFRINRARLY